MFGMEKKKALFEFDLEIDLKKDPNKKKVLLEEIDTKIHELKSHLRDGTDSKNFDLYGTLLHGYDALQKVIKKATNAQGGK